LSAHSLGILPLIPIILIPTPNKKVITSHTIDRTAGLKLLKIIYNRADRIIVHSKDMKKDLISLGINPSKIEIIPHGAKIPTLYFRQRDKITFFGAPIKGKGAYVLFEALKILKDKGERIKVHFYGIYSESEKEAACKRAKELNVDDCIVWGGRLSEREFDVKMQESMFTFTVYTEPVSGSSILTRAMANATPVIATNMGGLPEYSQKFSVLIPPNDPEALAQAILMLKNDQNLRTALGKIAREEAQKFSWDAIAKKTLKVYFDLLRLAK
jgi:glycosyltransferase involved in cell wall biosynthesis